MAFFPFKESSKNYFLDLTQLKTMEAYLQTFTKKHRKNLKYDIGQAIKAGYEIRIQDHDSTGLLDGDCKI